MMDFIDGLMKFLVFVLAIGAAITYIFGWTGLVIAIVIIFVIGFISHENEKNKEEKKEENLLDFDGEIDKLIKANSATIIRAYRHTVSENSFGEKDYRKFMKDFEGYFSDKLSYPAEEFLENNSTTWAEICKQNCLIFPTKVEDLLASKLKKANMSFKTPREYELYCAEQFVKAGWVASATQATADQGVDVMASKNSRTLAAQCKRFARAVGNKAVQEVVAGMKYYNCKEGVVIAPNGYTKSAMQLAKSNNVKLIHHDEIADL